VTEADLYDVFGRDHIHNIIIRSTRGCGVVVAGEEIGPDDRCYASVEVKGFKRTEEIMTSYDPKNRPVVHGLPITISLSAVDMPDAVELILRGIGYVPGEKSKYVNSFFACSLDCSLTISRTRRRRKPMPTKRITVQKTEIDIGHQQKPLAGPSRSAKLKPRFNPLAQTLRRDRA
jgi:hypothetical protein